MDMHDCSSSLIAAYGYEPKTEQMDIRFHKGGTYRYSNVPQEVFEGFLQADSKGRYFLAEIKPNGGKYPWEKL